MRLIYLGLLFTMFTQLTFAQWNPNGVTSGSIYYNGGNVGIGRDIPAFKLDVLGIIRSYGDLRTSGVANNNGYYADDGVGSTIFSITRQANNETRFQSYGYHTFYSGGNSGSERMRISDNGKVGIGVANPYSHSKVHIKADVNSPWTILAESNASGGVIGMGHNGDAGQISVSYLGSGTFLPLQFRTSNLERMTILANGRIGIDITSPTQKLDVVGRLKFRSDGSNSSGFWLTGNDGFEELFLGQQSGINSAAPFGIWHGGEWRLTVLKTGGVGIGTSSPGAKLEVNGDTNLGSNFSTVEGYGAKVSFLGVSENGDPLWMSRYNTSSNKSELRVNIGDDHGQNEDMFVVGTHHWNGGTWNPHLSVHASGNVGIGTTKPSQKLEVKGTVYSTEVKVDIAAGTGPDYVFEPTYNLPTLAETEAYIKTNKHLPEVPSAKEMESNGINLSEMNMLLLKKVEELTLHLIESEKRNLEYERRLKLIEEALLDKIK